MTHLEHLAELQAELGLIVAEIRDSRTVAGPGLPDDEGIAEALGKLIDIAVEWRTAITQEGTLPTYSLQPADLERLPHVQQVLDEKVLEEIDGGFDPYETDTEGYVYRISAWLVGAAIKSRGGKA